MRVTVHNISDRANAANDPRQLVIGGQRVRPGKSVVVDDSALNQKHWDMHGSRLWVGALPARFRKTVPRLEQPAGGGAGLTLEQARAYLSVLDVPALLDLAESMSPPVEFAEGLPQVAIVSRLSRALFQPERELDPQTFYWLGRWSIEDGSFIPKE